MEQYVKKVKRVDLNADVTRVSLAYKKKIGYDKSLEVREILQGDGETVMMVANAGGGKTYTILKEGKIITDMYKNVAILVTVPNRNQANQNQFSEDLKTFDYNAFVGADENGNKIEIDVRKQRHSCVYDKTLEAMQALLLNYDKVILVVDEAHKLNYDRYRKEALRAVEESIQLASQVVMMTATPKMPLRYYKFTDIVEFVDEDAQNNLKKLTVGLSRNPIATLITSVLELIEKDVTVYEDYVYDKWVVESDSMFDILEEHAYADFEKMNDDELFKIFPERERVGLTREVALAKLDKRKKVKVVEKGELITSKKLKVLIRLNNKKLIDTLMSVFERRGIKCERLTSDEKTGETFKSIENESKINGDAQVIFCTSVLEAGISLKNQELFLIEYIEKSNQFCKDNSIQYFARPRLPIAGGLIIARDYVNIKNLKNLKSSERANYQLINMNEKEIRTDYIKDERIIDITYEKATDFYNMAVRHFNLDKELYGLEEAVERFNSFSIQHQYSVDVVNAVIYDEASQELLIDRKKLEAIAQAEIDNYLLKVTPERFRTAFKNEIFYDDIEIKHHFDVSLEEDIETYMKEYQTAQSMVTAMEKDKARRMLEDNVIQKNIDAIINDEIHKYNFEEYNLGNYKLGEILSFGESSILSSYKELRDVLSHEDVVKVLTYITGCKKGTVEYLSPKQINYIVSRKDYANRNKDGKYWSNEKDYYSAIIDVAGKKKGKKAQIRAKDEICDELYVEYLRRGLRTNSKLNKIVKRAEKQAVKKGCSTYEVIIGDEGMKKVLDGQVTSTIRKNMRFEISKVFNVSDLGREAKIGAPHKKFNLDEILESFKK